MIEGKLRTLLQDLGVEIEGRNTSGWLVCKCPFAEDTHDGGFDRNPSFFVKIEPQGYSGFNCMTCKEKGPLTYMIKRLGYFRGKEDEYQKFLNRATLDEMPGDFGDYEEFEEEARELAPINENLMKGVLDPISKENSSYFELEEWLRTRDVRIETAMRMNLLWDDKEKRLIFPVRDYGALLYGFSGRTILPESKWGEMYSNFRKVKDYSGLMKDHLILGEDRIDPRLPLLVVEGLMAWLRMMEEGVDDFCNPVATLGSEMSEHQRDRIAMHDVPVYMLYDDDTAGDIGLYGRKKKGTDEFKGGGAIDMLKKFVPTYLCYYPEGKDDPDDLTRDEVKAIIESEHTLCS